MQDKQHTILIVDDAKHNIDILVDLLKEYDLITALDGESALAITAEEDVDLILLDIMMPEMDGFEVCQELQRNTNTLHIPVIFLSAKDSHEDIQKGFNLGAVDYITKPFNPNELLSRVNTHLKLRSYENHLEERINSEVQKNKLKEQVIHQQAKQAALGELLMHIAHQWKQPLASLGSIHLLLRTKFENNLEISNEELLDKIIQSEDLIEFMSDTVETFRNFYVPTEETSDFSLTKSIAKVLDISDATLHYHNIKTTLKSNETNNIQGNENEFTQVIFSIINNSMDIFKQRHIEGPHISIKVTDNKVTLSDNGGGIDANMIDDIFLPFKTSTNGTGIGLYIAKEIIEKNNGTINVHNSPDGAVFTIQF